MPKLIVMVFYVLLAGAATVQTEIRTAAGNGVKPIDPLKIAVPKSQFSGTAVQALSVLSRAAHVSGGFASVNSSCAPPAVKSWSTVDGMPLSAALNDIADLTSEWRVEDGVIDVLPRESLPVLLEVHVHRFEWDTGSPAASVISKLRSIPEVSEKAALLGLKELPFEGHSSGVCIGLNCPNQSLHPGQARVNEDVALIHILNEVVQAHEGTVWHYAEHRCQGQVKFTITVIGE
jgi:hypothetical protein